MPRNSRLCYSWQVQNRSQPMRVIVMYRYGGDHRHSGLWIANALRIVTSNHAQSLPMAGRKCWKVPSRLMTGSSLQQDFGLTGPALEISLPPLSPLPRVQGLGGFRAVSHLAAKLRCAKSHANYGVGAEERQEFLMQQSLADPTQWCDNRRSDPTAQHPDFRHTKSKVALWLNNRHKPAWVGSQLSPWDAVRKKSGESVSTSIGRPGALGRLPEREDHLEFGMSRILCEDGRLTDAVDALNFLVQRGCHVSTYLFYRVLKRCIAHKDLVVGRRIHALTVKSGYDGDAFLATHLIGLYASHGRLEEAMHIFNKVSTPSSYNWATIIFAHARHGEAVHAILLYRQMRESTTVKPTDRIYVAVLKACATAEDLAAGKEVHAHILASPGKPDIFVQTALVNMYAKCRSLADARSVFEQHLQRDVVTWTAMIAGYSQQGMGGEALALYSRMQQEGITPPDCVTYTCLLQACASVGVGALHQGKQLQQQIAERGLQDDVVLGASLVTMYTKCGSLEDARSVFDRLPSRNVMTWTAMIAGYAQQGMGQEALGLYSGMQQERLTPDSVTYVCLLQACATVGVGALHQGRQLHEQIAEQGLQDDVVLGGSLVHMYTKCGSLEDARTVFDTLPARNMLTWTAMIAGYAQQGMGQEALSLYNSMQQECLTPPDSVTFVCLLQACASVGVGSVHQGKQLHKLIAKQGLQDDVVLGGSLVNMYTKCGSLEDARSVFDRLPVRNVVTWTAMIAGYAQQGMGQEALSLYNGMQEECLTPDSVTFVCLLQACASIGVGGLYPGKQIHAQIEEQGLEDDVVLGGSLVNMYAKCGSLEDARRVFDRLPERNLVTWNAMLAGYAQQGMGQEALSLYCSMQQECLSSPDSVTFVCLLQACASVGVGALHQGKQLHAHAEEQGLQYDVVVGSSLVNMYAMCGTLEEARCVFDRLPERNVGTWNAMLAGYAQQGMGQEALTLYSSMQEEGIQPPDSVTFMCLLRACVSLGDVHQGKQLHAEIEDLGLQEDMVLGASLVNMYAKCGSLEEARSLFDRLPGRSVVTWTAMIAGYAQHGMGQEALTLYSSMQQEGLTLDFVAFLCLLEACASLAALPVGKQLHAQIKERGLEVDVVVGAALVNMYAKCGSMLDSQLVFDSLPTRTIEAWGALAAGYTRQGDSAVVFDLVDRMRLEGIEPNVIIFLSVLTVCSHVGLVDKGLRYFEAMGTEYGISPTAEHYTCMMDLLGRAGHLEKALQMAKAMPFPPDGTVWRTLLGACRKWNNIEIAQQAFEFAVGVDEKDAASYVLMSNIYASAEMWEEAKEMQARRKQFSAWKQPGQSWWTDIDGVVHTFVVGDKKTS